MKQRDSKHTFLLKEKLMEEDSQFMITDLGLLKKIYPDNLDELKDEFGDCIVRS